MADDRVRYRGNKTGILYEPRAFWSTLAVDPTDPPARTPNNVRRFNQDDFFNGEKWPVTLTKLLIAPTGYIFREHQNGAPVDELTYHAGACAALMRSRLVISAPQRQYYNRRPILIPSWTAQPTWEPQIRGAADNLNQPLVYASSLWNAYRWDFDHTMLIPKLGTLEIQLAAVDAPNFTPGGNEFLDARMDFTVGVFEGPPVGDRKAGGRLLFPGNARLHERSLLRMFNRLQPDGVTPNLPGIVQDGLSDPNYGQGAETTPGVVTMSQQFFPPDQQLSTREYDSQNATQAGSTPVTGFAVHVDQIEHDNTIETGATGLGGGGNPIAPVGLRAPTRARMTNGGSGAWWWRSWAPLALVCPTLTPALVYELPRPITIGPGDTLDIELEVPAPITIGETPIEQTYTVGVSLTGYAAIEG